MGPSWRASSARPRSACSLADDEAPGKVAIRPIPRSGKRRKPCSGACATTIPGRTSACSSPIGSSSTATAASAASTAAGRLARTHRLSYKAFTTRRRDLQGVDHTGELAELVFAKEGGRLRLSQPVPPRRSRLQHRRRLRAAHRPAWNESRRFVPLVSGELGRELGASRSDSTGCGTTRAFCRTERRPRASACSLRRTSASAPITNRAWNGINGFDFQKKRISFERQRQDTSRTHLVQRRLQHRRSDPVRHRRVSRVWDDMEREQHVAAVLAAASPSQPELQPLRGPAHRLSKSSTSRSSARRRPTSSPNAC